MKSAEYTIITIIKYFCQQKKLDNSWYYFN